MSARARQDLTLVAAALAGRAGAHEEPLRHCRTAVCHLVLRIVPQSDDAEDAEKFRFLTRIVWETVSLCGHGGRSRCPVCLAEYPVSLKLFGNLSVRQAACR